MPKDFWRFGSQVTKLSGESSLAVEAVWPQIEFSLLPAARRITEDRDQQDDLVQEALVELWMIDPTRFDLRERKEFNYLRRMLVNRMWDVWRGETPGRRH